MTQKLLIPPDKLREMRKRCQPIVKRLCELDMISETASPIAPNTSSTVVAVSDRYGFPIRTAICNHTGLIYLVDHFTQEAYSTFYKSGGYRDLITRFKNYQQTIEVVELAQRRYTQKLINILRDYLYKPVGAKLLDIGGSTGLTAKAFQDAFGYDVTVLEPAPNEVMAAKRLGINAVQGSIETWETDQKYDVILMCRTIEHVFDLPYTLVKIRQLLADDGVFFCDIVDYFDVCRREGPPQVTSKIDHKQWLCQENTPAILKTYGLNVKHSFMLAVDQIGYLTTLSETTYMEPMPTDWINERIRFFRQIESDWMAQPPSSFSEMVWRKIYPIKKKLIR
ncbi:MAG: class I SAM-dependent methyltransferase [Anaerolineae bacterium]|nr:class I SAM-dependent methyltransferase [Anaerolineae bacterium]